MIGRYPSGSAALLWTFCKKNSAHFTKLSAFHAAFSGLFLGGNERYFKIFRALEQLNCQNLKYEFGILPEKITAGLRIHLSPAPAPILSHSWQGRDIYFWTTRRIPTNNPPARDAVIRALAVAGNQKDKTQTAA